MSMAMACNHLFYYVSVLGLKKKAIKDRFLLNEDHLPFIINLV